MPLPKSFLHDTLFSAINSVAAILKPFALVYLINNYLGTEAYGQIAVFLSSIALVSILSSLGVGFSMRRHISGDVDLNTKRRLFYLPLNFQLILLLVYFLVACYYASFGPAKISLTELGIFSFYYLATILFQYFLEYRRWTLNASGFVTVSALYSTLFLSVLFAAFQFDVVQNVYQILIVDALIMFVIFLYLFSTVYKELGVFFGTFNRVGLLKEIKLGMPYAIGGLGEITMAAADRFMIVYFFGLFEAGLYSSGYMLGSLSLIFVRLIGLFLPQHMFSSRDGSDYDGVNKLLNFSVLSFFSVSIPFVFFLILFGSKVLSFINIDSDQAFFSMILISISSIFLGCYLLMSSVTLMEKKTAFQMNLVVIFSLFNVVANYFFMWLFDSFVLASAVTLTTYFLLASIFFWYLRGIWTFNFPLKFFLIPLGAASLSYGIMRLIERKLLSLATDFFAVEVILFLSLYAIVLMGGLAYLKIISVGKILRFK